MDPTRLGVRATEEGAAYRGGDVLVAGGYARIPAELLDGVDVRLRSAVTAVTATDSGARVRLASGQALTADVVVVAVPLALLRAGKPTIDPMPAAVKRAMRSLVTGTSRGRAALRRAVVG